ESRDGQKRTSLEITADSLVNLEKRTREEGEGEFAAAAAPARQPAGNGGNAPRGGFDDTELDVLPFCPSAATALISSRDLRVVTPGEHHAHDQIQETRRLLP